MALSVPVKNGFSQTGSSGDDCNVFLGMIDAAIQIEQILRLEILQAASGSNQVVHQHDAFARQTQTGGERSRIKHPGNMRGVQASVDNSSGDAESRDIQRGPAARAISKLEKSRVA